MLEGYPTVRRPVPARLRRRGLAERGSRRPAVRPELVLLVEVVPPGLRRPGPRGREMRGSHCQTALTVEGLPVPVADLAGLVEPAVPRSPGELAGSGRGPRLAAGPVCHLRCRSWPPRRRPREVRALPPVLSDAVVAPGHLFHTPQDKLFPVPSSAAVIVPIPIRKAISAGTRVAPIMERLRRGDRLENQSSAARSRPMKLFRRSGRPGRSGRVMFHGSFIRDARSRILPGALRTRPEMLSR